MLFKREKKVDYLTIKENVDIWIIWLITDMNLRWFFILQFLSKLTWRIIISSVLPLLLTECFLSIYLTPFPFTWLWGLCELYHIYRGGLEIFPILWKPAWQKKTIISMSLDAPFSSTKWIKITLKAM